MYRTYVIYKYIYIYMYNKAQSTLLLDSLDLREGALRALEQHSRASPRSLKRHRCWHRTEHGRRKCQQPRFFYLHPKSMLNNGPEISKQRKRPQFNILSGSRYVQLPGPQSMYNQSLVGYIHRFWALLSHTCGVQVAESRL